MRPLRRFALLAAIALCAPLSVHAQPPRAESGLLLGLSDGRTYWMPRDSAGFRLATIVNHLVVPRTDGWWFVASTARCGLDIDSAHGGGGIGYSLAFVLRYQGIAVARAGSAPTIALGDTIPCDAAEARIERERERQYREALAKVNGDTSQVSRGDYFDAESMDCVDETEAVTFLSSRAVSVARRYRQTEYCSPGGYATSGSNAVARVDTNAALPLRAILSPRVRRETLRAFGTEESCASFEVTSREDVLDTQWIVRRRMGAWVADVWVDGPTACRGGSDIELAVPLPRSFTGDAPLPVAWAALAKAYPDLVDAVASPSGAYVALILPNAIRFHRVRAGRLAEPAGVAGARDDYSRPVMIRWATREEAVRWTRELPRLTPPVARVEGPKYGSQ